MGLAMPDEVKRDGVFSDQIVGIVFVGEVAGRAILRQSSLMAPVCASWQALSSATR